jgi:hypothetical protein
MKILYFTLPLWILVALPSFVEKSVVQANNQFDIYEQLLQHKPPKERKDHRGSGRKYNS